MVSDTTTGDAEVGFTDADGEKLQVAPVGSPLHERLTVPANDPEAVTEKLMTCEVFGRFTVTELGDGAVNPKSTTCKVNGASCVTVFVSDPTP
jgi:hypothetical protein